jgi:putative CocE/NonD family hydrolase
VHLVGGWYDFFLRGLLADYAALRDAGQKPYLTIAPTHHFNGMVSPLALREGLRWFDAHLKGEQGALRERPVHVYMMGLEQWRALNDFPPPSREALLYLGSEAALQPSPASDIQEGDRYLYDPANPTPILGGNQFNPHAGAKDNRSLEARSDVLTYTSSVLEQPVEVMGTARLTLYARSSVEHTDFFARLCDVCPDGRSINICDGFLRVTPESAARQPDGTLCLEIDLWATAYYFKRGHRIRLIIASGAHPRWARNLGTGESWVNGQTLRQAQQTILHDRERPSRLSLPLTAGSL